MSIKYVESIKSQFDGKWAPNNDSDCPGWVHGMSAYNAVHGVEAIMERLYNLEAHPEWEVCVTDYEHIGPFGVYLQGHMEALFSGDVYSYIDPETGRRVADEETARERGCRPIHDWLDYRRDGGYVEGFLTNFHISGLWISDRYARRHPDVEQAFREECQCRHVVLDILKDEDEEFYETESLAVDRNVELALEIAPEYMEGW